MNKRLRRKKLRQLNAIKLSMEKLIDIAFLESETPHDEELMKRLKERLYK